MNSGVALKADGEDKPRDFKHHSAQLGKQIDGLSAISTALLGGTDGIDGAIADANLTVPAAKHEMRKLKTFIADQAAALVSAQSAMRGTLDDVNAQHASAVRPTDKGSLENVAKVLASDNDSDQLALTKLVNRGVNENENKIIALMEQGNKSKFLRGRIKERPDPLIPTLNMKPTPEQAMTHAIHAAVKADNPRVLAAVWRNLELSADEFPTFLMELYQGAGYFRPAGSIEKPSPKPSICELITRPDYLNCLSTEQLNDLLIGMAGHPNDIDKELSQFLNAIPEARRQEIKYGDALAAAAWDQEHGTEGSLEKTKVLLAYATQAEKDNIYETVASARVRGHMSGAKKSRAIEIADALLEAATNPLPVGVMSKVAKAGYPENVEHALAKANVEDLPAVLAAIVKPPAATPEENIVAVLKKLEDGRISLDSAVLSAVLDHAVSKGQIHLLGEVMKIEQVQPLLNTKERKPDHDNLGGNRILYKAANYNGSGFSRTPEQKKEDVRIALTMVRILHNQGRGAEIFPNDRHETVMDVLSRRIASDAPELKENQYYRALQADFDNQLAAARARAEETARINVQREQGMGLGNPVEQRRLMLVQLNKEADDMLLNREQRAAHIRRGVELFTSTPGGTLALGAGDSPQTPPKTVKRDNPPEIMIDSIDPPSRE